MSTYSEGACRVVFEGRSFEALGAEVTPDRVAAYPRADGILTDWHGRPIGRWRAVASWPIVSYLGSRMYQIEATVSGVTYTGRGLGAGMLYRGRRKARQGAR